MSPQANLGFNDDENSFKFRSQATPWKYEIVPSKLFKVTYIHLAGIYGAYLCFGKVAWPTLVFNLILYICSTLGMTAGYHRLWSHRAYKAKLPLQIILLFFNCLHGQSPAIPWIRDHRLHHKYCDTDADVQNTSRGFFYSHIGWTVVKQHPDVKEKAKTLDFTDVFSNPLLRFQKKYQWTLYTIFALGLPTLIPMYFWSESLSCAWHANMLRTVLFLQFTFCINSVVHFFGFKPYDNRISATQSIVVSLGTLGEGFHNYHHVFPYDYRASELGSRYTNLTTLFIDLMAKIGWAYDLKFVDEKAVKSRQMKTGDGTVDRFSKSEKKKNAIRWTGN